MDVKAEAAGSFSTEVNSADTKTADDHTFQQNILVAAKGGSVSFAGRLFEYAIRFVFSIIVANWIGAEQYGLYTLGLTIVPIASMLSLLGLQTGVVAFLPPAIHDKDESRIWGIIQVCGGIPALLSFAFGALLFAFANPIAVAWFHEPRLIPLLRVVSLAIPLEALGFIAYQIIISYKQPKFSVLANNIILPSAKLGLTVIFLLLGLGVFGIISAHVISTAVALALILYFVNALFPLRRPIHTAKRETGRLLRYSLPVHVGWVLSTVRGTLETLVLGFVGLTTGVGVFAVAQRLSSLGTLFFLAVGNISTPLIADLYSRGQFEPLRKLYQTTTRWVITFNLPLFLAFVFFTKPLLSIFGGDFTTGAAGLVVLAVGNLVYTGTGPGANVLDMTNHTKFNSINSVFMLVVTIASDLLLIPRWGVIGAAAASAFSTVIVNIVCLLEVYFLVKMQPYEPKIFKPILAGLFSAVVVYLFNSVVSLPSLLLLFTGSLVLWGSYALSLAVLGFSADDKLVMKNMLARFGIRLPLRKPAA